jgi:hypothetical protein
LYNGAEVPKSLLKRWVVVCTADNFGGGIGAALAELSKKSNLSGALGEVQWNWWLLAVVIEAIVTIALLVFK